MYELTLSTESRLRVHLQSGSPMKFCLNEAATELSGSEFVLEYVNPDLRFGMLREGSW